MSIRTYRACFAMICVIMVLPVFIAAKSYYYGSLTDMIGNPPAVGGSDEEHYLAMINSITRDGDFDLRNNYLNSHRGGNDAGRIYANLFYAHQVMWMHHGIPVIWKDVMNLRDVQGGVEVTFKPGFEDLAGLPEYSWHPYSFAILMAGPAWLARPFVTEETSSLLTMCGLGLVSFALLAALFARMGLGRGEGLFLATAAIVTTPWWHYNRTLFTEGMIACFQISSIYLWYRFRDRAAAGWAGLPLGLCATFKPPLAVIYLPYLADWVRAKRFRPFLVAVGWGAVCLGILFGLNTTLFGGPFNQPAPVFLPWATAMGAMFWKVRSAVFWSCPTFFLSFYGFYRAYREDRRAGLLLSGGFFSYWITLLFVHNWWGGGQYGPRYLVPIIPYASVALAYAWRAMKDRRSTKVIFMVVLLVALIPNMFAALFPMLFIKAHPWEWIANYFFGYMIPVYDGG